MSGSHTPMPHLNFSVTTPFCFVWLCSHNSCLRYFSTSSNRYPTGVLGSLFTASRKRVAGKTCVPVSTHLLPQSLNPKRKRSSIVSAELATRFCMADTILVATENPRLLPGLENDGAPDYPHPSAAIPPRFRINPLREVNLSLVVDSLYGTLLIIGLVVHPAGDVRLVSIALYRKAYLSFLQSYVGIRVVSAEA